MGIGSSSRREFFAVAATAFTAFSAVFLGGCGKQPQDEPDKPATDNESEWVEVVATFDPSSETVEFGSYPSTAEGDLAPIEWYVLAEKGSMRLLLSKRLLDAVPYNEESVDITWETCTLRAWLNGEFLQEAFSDEERALIAETEIANDPNPNFPDTPSGPPTLDRVFCLSLQEVERYLGVPQEDWTNFNSEGVPHPEINAEPTDWAVNRGVYVNVGYEYEGITSPAGGTYWWLRSPSADPDAVCTVEATPYGVVDTLGRRVDVHNFGVRPALWLNREP